MYSSTAVAGITQNIWTKNKNKNKIKLDIRKNVQEHCGIGHHEKHV
jgi:hypothetical protein